LAVIKSHFAEAQTLSLLFSGKILAERTLSFFFFFFFFPLVSFVIFWAATPVLYQMLPKDYRDQGRKRRKKDKEPAASRDQH
jgi:hypothetical protein